MITINYKKQNNCHLFDSLEKMNVYNLQNYIPLYNFFFQMNEENNNLVNFEIDEPLISFEKSVSYNIIEGFIGNDELKKKKKQIFLKYAPLIDPIRYMVGKFKDEELVLPQFNLSQNNFENVYLNKIYNKHNSSYVDGLFSFLLSKLYKKGFVNAINFHGMFIGKHKI